MADPATSTFGKAGSMTTRADKAAVVIDTSRNREQVICTVTVSGGRPAFLFKRLKKGTAAGDVLQDSAMQPVVKRYQWVLSASDGTLAIGEAAYTLSMSFASAGYTYTMEHCDEFGGRIAMLKDKDYESADGEDTHHEPIAIEAK